MGIEIPPPKGGPAVFTNSSPGHESPVAFSPDDEQLGTSDLGDHLNDEGSVCLSEGDDAAHSHLHLADVSVCQLTQRSLI